MSDPDRLVGAVAGDDLVKALRALLRDLTVAYTVAGVREKATLGRLVRDVRLDLEAAIAGATPEAKGTVLDELTARRKAAGSADPTTVAGPAGAAKRRR